jgi:hypothetical protein
MPLSGEGAAGFADSFDDMVQDPVATTASHNPALSTLARP